MAQHLHKKPWIVLHFFVNMTVLKKVSFQLSTASLNSFYQTKLHGIDIDVSWCIARKTTQKTLFEGTFPHVFITFTPHSISTKWLNSVCVLFGLDSHLKFNIAREKVPSPNHPFSGAMLNSEGVEDVFLDGFISKLLNRSRRLFFDEANLAQPVDSGFWNQ